MELYFFCMNVREEALFLGDLGVKNQIVPDLHERRQKFNFSFNFN